jgi:DNA-binding transcriptional regulator YdaS (Cro superfamily)
VREFLLQQVFWRFVAECEDAAKGGRSELAELTGISEKTIGHYLTGRTHVPVEAVDALMRARGIRIASEILRELMGVAGRLERSEGGEDLNRVPARLSTLELGKPRGASAGGGVSASAPVEPELPLNAAAEKKRADREALQPGQKRRRRKTAH